MFCWGTIAAVRVLFFNIPFLSSCRSARCIVAQPVHFETFNFIQTCLERFPASLAMQASASAAAAPGAAADAALAAELNAQVDAFTKQHAGTTKQHPSPVVFSPFPCNLPNASSRQPPAQLRRRARRRTPRWPPS